MRAAARKLSEPRRSDEATKAVNRGQHLRFVYQSQAAARACHAAAARQPVPLSRGMITSRTVA